MKKTIATALTITALLTPKPLQEDKNTHLDLCPNYSITHSNIKEELEESIDKTVEWFNLQGIPSREKSTRNCIPITFYEPNEFIKEFLKDEEELENKIESPFKIKFEPIKINNNYNKFLEEHHNLNKKLDETLLEKSNSLIEETIDFTTSTLLEENNISDILANHYSKSINSTLGYVHPKNGEAVVKINLQSILMNYNHEFLKQKNKFSSKDMKFSNYLATIIAHEIGHSLFLEHPESLYNEEVVCETPNIMNLQVTPSKEQYNNTFLGRRLSSFQKEFIKETITPGTSLYKKRSEEPFPTSKPLEKIIKKENITQKEYECY